ncbi:MAG TPA: hypothetical protein VK973_01410, partial [Arenicellales bacterium]|nr:hypothetical protein [Arenicellales bacterium]
ALRETGRLNKSRDHAQGVDRPGKRTRNITTWNKRARNPSNTNKKGDYVNGLSSREIVAS